MKSSVQKQITAAFFAAIILLSLSPGASATIEEDIEVSIDIRPCSTINNVNTNSGGLIPVAILTTNNFDSGDVVPGTVKFGPAEAEAQRSLMQDVDKDGDLDLLLWFLVQDTGIEVSGPVTLTGETKAGNDFTGTDNVFVNVGYGPYNEIEV